MAEKEYHVYSEMKAIKRKCPKRNKSEILTTDIFSSRRREAICCRWCGIGRRRREARANRHHLKMKASITCPIIINNIIKTYHHHLANLILLRETRARGSRALRRFERKPDTAAWGAGIDASGMRDARGGIKYRSNNASERQTAKPRRNEENIRKCEAS